MRTFGGFLGFERWASSSVCPGQFCPAKCHENFDTGPVIIAESSPVIQSSTALFKIVKEIWPPTALGLPDTKFGISKSPITLTSLWSLRFIVGANFFRQSKYYKHRNMGL